MGLLFTIVDGTFLDEEVLFVVACSLMLARRASFMIDQIS